MFYILDALRRADSDRDRGSVPNLHSNARSQGPVDDEDDDTSASSVRPLWWAVAGLSTLTLAMMAWLIFGRAVPQVESTSPPPAVEAAAPAVVADAPQQPLVVATPQPVVPVPASPVPVSPAPSPPARVAVVKPAKRVAKPADAASDLPPDVPVPSISELPDEIRRQIPPLNVSGASYSKTPASRMLILNGQVFHEGDSVANDLVLEQIRLKSAVLSFRGQRYSVSY